MTKLPIYKLNTFTPGDAEAISGINVDLQRLWRRRDLLPKTEGHARFNVVELAQMKVLKALADFGVALEVRSQVSKLSTRAIVEAVLSRHNLSEFKPVYDGNWPAWVDYAVTPAGHVEYPEPGWRAEIFEKALTGKNPSDYQYYVQGDLARFVFRDMADRGAFGFQGSRGLSLSKLVIVTADGAVHWTNTIDDLWHSDEHTAARTALRRGAAVIIDHELFAEDMVEASQRPFVTIKIPEATNA